MYLQSNERTEDVQPKSLYPTIVVGHESETIYTKMFGISFKCSDVIRALAVAYSAYFQLGLHYPSEIVGKSITFIRMYSAWYIKVSTNLENLENELTEENYGKLSKNYE